MFKKGIVVGLVSLSCITMLYGCSSATSDGKLSDINKVLNEDAVKEAKDEDLETFGELLNALDAYKVIKLDNVTKDTTSITSILDDYSTKFKWYSLDYRIFKTNSELRLELQLGKHTGYADDVAVADTYVIQLQ